MSACGLRIREVRALFIEANTNWCLCSRVARRSTGTTSSWDSLAAIARIFGSTHACIELPHSSNAEEPNLQLHPTVKPVAMVAEAIMDCTARGEIILDAFLGSGTTLVAAERVGRICYPELNSIQHL